MPPQKEFKPFQTLRFDWRQNNTQQTKHAGEGHFSTLTRFCLFPIQALRSNHSTKVLKNEIQSFHFLERLYEQIFSERKGHSNPLTEIMISSKRNSRVSKS